MIHLFIIQLPLPRAALGSMHFHEDVGIGPGAPKSSSSSMLAVIYVVHAMSHTTGHTLWDQTHSTCNSHYTISQV